MTASRFHKSTTRGNCDIRKHSERLFLLTINSCNSIGTGTAYQLNPTQLLISISTQVLTFFFFTNKNIYNFYIFQIRQRVQAI
ncbi:unnamed protein product [Tenebrio molitor]|nr:unnamed protein product [Tenebrio molitor]